MGLTGLEITWVSVYGAVYVAFLIWIARDAQKHGMNPAVWVVVVFIFNLVGLVLYLISRPAASSARGGVAPQ